MALEDIAGYSLRRKLGSRIGRTVWLVRDRASGRNAVLKRVPMTAISHPEELREDLTVLQSIDHPHVARLREVRETRTEWLLFTQYVVAGTLTALLSRRGPLTDGELVTLLSPLAEALDHLHHTGLTHGRVTPANIMFDADGRPVLTDAVLHTTHPTAPTDDLTSLAAVAHQSGGDPAVFTPDLFTTTHPHDLLTLTTPIPINLAFTRDPTPTDTADDSTTTNSTTSPPRPRPTTKPPTTDDPVQRARDPLAPPPKKPSSPHPSQPTPPQPPPPKPTPRSTKPTRRKPRLPKLTRRTRPTPTPINPLSRLTPPAPPTSLTPDPATTPANTPAIPDFAARPSLEAFHPATNANHLTTTPGHPAANAGQVTSTASLLSATSADHTERPGAQTAATPHLADTSSTEGAISTSDAWGGGAAGFPSVRRAGRRAQPCVAVVRGGEGMHAGDGSCDLFTGPGRGWRQAEQVDWARCRGHQDLLRQRQVRLRRHQVRLREHRVRRQGRRVRLRGRQVLLRGCRVRLRGREEADALDSATRRTAYWPRSDSERQLY